MTDSWKHLLAGIEQNPERWDLVSGVVCLCRTLQNPAAQALLLVDCSALILRAQPILALQMLRLALLLNPKEYKALAFAKEIFQRRGRWASEQRVAELMTTLNRATAVSPTSPLISQVGLGEGFLSSSAENEKTVKPMVTQNEQIPFRHVEGPEFDFQKEKSTFDKLRDSSFDMIPDSVEQIQQNQPLNIAISERLDSNQNIFSQFLDSCEFDSNWIEYSSGFSPNHTGLVAYVSFLLNMNLIDASDKTKALVVLYRMIKESKQGSGAEELFDKLFIPAPARKEK